MKKLLCIPILVFGFLACQQTPLQLENNTLGVLELRLDSSGVNTGKVVRVRVGGLQTQGTLREADVTFTTLTTTATQNDGAFDYVQAQFSVQNSSNTAFNNLTLYAVAKAGNIAGTAIKSITNFGGLSDTLEQTRISKLVTPTHGVNVSSSGASLIAGREDMQLFTTTEVSALQADPAWNSNGFSSNDKVLGYGFVARRCIPNCTNPTSFTRGIAAGQSGLITIALKIPRTTGTAYDFVMTFAVVDEPITRVTRSVYPPETLQQAENRLSGLGATSELMQLGLARAASLSANFTNQGADAVAVSSDTTNSNASYTALGLERFSAGGYNTCALTAAGAAYCWGDNFYGQLGNGTTVSSAAPFAVSGNIVFSSLTTGGNLHTCGIEQSTNRAYCWGFNGSGQLGTGNTGNSSVPVAVIPPISGSITFSSLVAGDNHTCGLTFGEVYCWGGNSIGQLGNGSFSSSSRPQKISNNFAFSSITAGATHTCGISSLILYCWGNNSNGQLGNGSTISSSNPVVISGTFSSVSAGNGHTCGIENLNGVNTARCWGTNGAGQLGTNNTQNSQTPITVQNGSSLPNVILGGGFSCSLVSGTAYCWGSNNSGQLGTGNTTNRLIPTAVGGNIAFSSLSAAFRNTCGLTSTGAAYCWGSNIYLQAGVQRVLTFLIPTRDTTSFKL